MRAIESHRLAGEDKTDLNHRLLIAVLDGPGPGGACHQYVVCEDTGGGGESTMPRYIVKFQEGPIREKGLNGVSNEALLAIVQDRLEGFQSGAFACDENAQALEHVRSALTWLRTRTRRRLDRGVEGTSKA